MAEESRLETVQRMFSSARSGFEKNASQQTGPVGDVKPRPVPGITRQGMVDGTVQFAPGRNKDPLWYWRQNNVPFDIWTDRTGNEMRRVHELCNAPEAPVWMGDYSFKQIGDIAPGEEVIGWERYEVQSGPKGVKQQKSRLVKTKVLAVRRRMAPMIIRVTMESGRVIRCTPDHKWANYYYSPTDPRAQEFIMPATAQMARVNAGFGSALRRVIDPTPELASEKERLAAAWLGGMYDGEGHYNYISQSVDTNSDVCEALRFNLDLLGLTYTEVLSKRIEGHSDCINFVIGSRGAENRGNRGAGGGSRQDFVNFLNWADPVRRTRAVIDKNLLTSNFGEKDVIVSIEEEGPGEVVSMQTETGNYTAWGYASSNCRLLYVTHPLLGSAIDIYARYPLSGMEIVCGKDQSIADFYSELFLNDLNYEEYLVDIGREHWLVGEAFPLASFNDLTGVWDSDDLMLPEDVNVIKTPFATEPRFEMALPYSIRKILDARAPQLEYRQLIENYPEFLSMNIGNWVTAESERYLIPVSGQLMQQVMRKGDSFHPRGISIMMRAFRAVAQEEMLNSAQDSISQRLYTPLLMARIGASATDLGMDTAWIPSQADLDSFVEDVNLALSADFRLIVTHFAAQIQSVFGREQMPNLDNDFDRLEDKMLQSFGLSKTMLSGADSGQTYAADALNRDLVTQLLSEYQRKIRRFFRKRCEVVAEAQGHYDFTRKGGRSVPIMERVQETDQETGEIRFVDRPKLLIPELRIKAMNMKDEEKLEGLLSDLRASGVPISQRSRLVNLPIDLDDELEATMHEQVEQAVMAQEVRKRTYLAFQARGLPIPEDLKKDFEAHVIGGGDKSAVTSPAGTPQTIPTLGLVDPALTDALVPTDSDVKALTGGPAAPKALERKNVVADPQRPAESDEQRAGMPKAAWMKDGDEFVFERTFGHKIVVTKTADVAEEGEEQPDDEVTTEDMSMPVLGSYRTRHMGHRDKEYFYQDRDHNGETYEWDHLATLDDPQAEPEGDPDDITIG